MPGIGGLDMNDSPFDDLKKELLARIWIERVHQQS